jgi:hypothetical protein
MAAMPQPPACVELEAAPVLFGVDHEHPTGADHKVINIGCRAWDGQVVQDGPPVPFQRSKQPGGAPLPPAAAGASNAPVVHCCPRMNFGSSVERTATLHPL